ncbi:MAG: hypothetical protein SCARUB_05102, partial [Candidatus Scalindua rubra]
MEKNDLNEKLSEHLSVINKCSIPSKQGTHPISN